MTTSDARKQGKIRLARIERTAEELAQLELAERVNRVRIGKGKKRPRRFNKLREDELFPLRLVGRLTDDAIQAEADDQGFLDAVVSTVTRLIRRKQRGTIHLTGDFDLAS